MWKSLRVQVAALLGLAVLALVVTLALVLGWLAAEASEREQSRLLQTLARSTGLLLAEGLDERLREVQALAEARPAPTLQEWGPALQRLQDGRPQYSWIGVVQPDGRVASAAGGLLVGADVGRRDWFLGGLKGPYVGDVHPAKLLATLLPPAANGEPLRFVDFAAPVFTPAGELQGVLGVHLTWDWARDVTRRVRDEGAAEAGTEIFVIDHAGQLILGPPGYDTRQSVPYIAPDDPAGSQRVWGDGRAYLSAAASVVTQLPATRLGWTVVARQPLHLAQAAARQARNTALVAAGVGAVMAALLAWSLAGLLSRRLGRIATAAQALRAGRLDTEIPRLSGTRELAELSDTLRGMTAALLQREAELAQANQGLEQRVQARTAELVAAQQQLQEANAALEGLARRDTLTGLPNRRSAEEQLAQALARQRRSGSPLCVALLDIDRFKAVNDTHGHGAGDAVLRAVAQTLAVALRQSDVVARWGGEEFLLLMPDTGLAGAQTVCEKLRSVVAQRVVPLPPGPDGEPAVPDRLTVTLSIGVAGLPGDRAGGALAADALVAAADRALYAAKEGGRNRVVVDGSR